MQENIHPPIILLINFAWTIFKKLAFLQNIAEDKNKPWNKIGVRILQNKW